MTPSRGPLTPLALAPAVAPARRPLVLPVRGALTPVMLRGMPRAVRRAMGRSGAALALLGTLRPIGGLGGGLALGPVRAAAVGALGPSSAGIPAAPPAPAALGAPALRMLAALFALAAFGTLRVLGTFRAFLVLSSLGTLGVAAAAVAVR